MPDSANPAAQVFVKDQIESVKAKIADVSIYNIKGNINKFNYLKAAYQIQRLIRKNDFDIIHGHYVYSGWIAALQFRVPLVVSFMGSDLNGSARESGSLELQSYVDILLSKLLQYVAHGIIVKTEKMKHRIFLKNKCIVLPNGVDFNKFREIPRHKARNKLKLDQNKKYILFAGNYKRSNKAFHIIQAAAKILKDKNDQVNLLLAYNQPHDLMPYYMNAANVLALSSWREGSVNVVKEAMACNLPIVSTDVGDVKEIIAKTQGCRIVKRNPLEFAQMLDMIIHTYDRTEGRKAIQHLRIENIAQRLIDFYEMVISGGRN
jgi:glycosyltransferase involved in cell wall biosynthesis